MKSKFHKNIFKRNPEVLLHMFPQNPSQMIARVMHYVKKMLFWAVKEMNNKMKIRKAMMGVMHV